MHRCKGGIEVASELDIVEADHGDVAGHAEPGVFHRPDESHRHFVVRGENRGRPPRMSEELLGDPDPGVEIERALPDDAFVYRNPGFAQGVAIARKARHRLDVVGGPHSMADAAVAEVKQVADNRYGGIVVVDFDDG